MTDNEKNSATETIDNEVKCEKCFHQSVCEKKTCAECQSSYCDECELYDFYNGKPYVEDCEKFIDVDLIKRKDEQIEGLIAGQETLQKALNEKIAEVKMLQTYITNHPYRVVVENADIYTENHEEYEKLLVKLSTEAVTEFAERLKENKIDIDVSFGYGKEVYTEAVAVVEIDNLVKEMVGDAE